MSAERLSARYARSIMDLAIEKGQLDKIHNDFISIKEILNSSRELLLMIKSPIIKSEKKWNVLDKIFSGKVHKITRQFLRLIVKKGRESFLPDIAKSFENQYQKLQEITPVKITTAVLLNDELLSKIQSILKESGKVKNTEWEKEVDQGILGGFILEFDDQMIDASVRGKLEKLKRELA